MRESKSLLSLALGSGLLLSVLPASGATMTVDTTEPTGALVSNPHSPFATGMLGPLGERDTFTTAFSAAGGYGSRGQTFLMPDNPTGDAWNLSAITVRADANPDGSGVAQDFSTGGPHTLKLWVFQWAPSDNANTGTQWNAGDGSNDDDPFDGTGITNFLVNGETFDVTRAFSGEFLHFATPGLQVAENTAYGYLLSFQSAGATGLRLDQVRDGTAPTGQAYPDGAFLRSDATAHSFGQSGDDMVFYVEATPVPEPAAAAGLLAVASFAIPFSRRRR
jgi:hypothetical protein